MSHGHQGDHHGHHEHTNPHAIQETDEQLTQKVRPIELIKHNPNLFHVNAFDPNSIY